MSFWTAIFLIVAFTTIAGIYQDRQKRQRRASKVEMDNGADAARLRSEVTRLNERIKVLERLAVDPGKRLADEIDSLKDK